MHAQQIDITHGLHFPFFIMILSFSFLQHYNNQNTTTDYPQHDQLFHQQSFKGITPLYAG